MAAVNQIDEHHIQPYSTRNEFKWDIAFTWRMIRAVTAYMAKRQTLLFGIIF